MEMDYSRPPCPILDVDGVISGGKQFDLDIMLPEDNRDVIYGVVKNCFKEPVCNAAVKLVEIVHECGKEERRPIGHTFTDEDGEFVFGPLCPGRKYAIQIWANTTKKIKICAKCFHEGDCLKGDKHDKCDCFIKDEKHDEHEECHDKDDKHDKHDECHDKYDKYDKHDECHDKDDKCDKHDECHDKDDKHDKHDECHDKDDKYDKHDECYDKDDKYDKCDCFKKDIKCNRPGRF